MLTHMMFIIISKGISDDHISTCRSIQFAFGVILNSCLQVSWFSWCVLLKWWSSVLYRVCWMLWRNLIGVTEFGSDRCWSFTWSVCFQHILHILSLCEVEINYRCFICGLLSSHMVELCHVSKCLSSNSILCLLCWFNCIYLNITFL